MAVTKRGRPRLADAEKAKKGTLRKDRIHKTAAPVVAKIETLPDPPDFLNEAGKQEWRVKVDMLDKMNMLAKTDLGILAALCKEWQNYVAAEGMCDANARFYSVKDDIGKIKYWGIHPAHTIAQQHLKAYQSLCNEFGFSPASRSKISLPQDKHEKSKAARLLKSAV